MTEIKTNANAKKFINIKGEGNTGCCIPYDEIKTIEDVGPSKRSRYSNGETLIKLIDGERITVNIPYEKVIKQLKKLPEFEILG
ncbi:hypothetical protein [Pectobacterium versatile]|uniref:hypothetical protein n=1 Tax=Pectobacterium versatile TaxID=2488639 RepID=UPI001F283D74|nr:hypothetical protein [Pectobacterium versatile]